MSFRVRIVGRSIKKGYSGGRLLSMIMAESLARNGATVDYLISVLPQMYNEFQDFSQVKYIVTNFNNLRQLTDKSIDIVVVVPDMGDSKWHEAAAQHALNCNAKLVLLNFETPNWFNSVSPYPRDPSRWHGWVEASKACRLILSISKEGNNYAKNYFESVPKNCQFEYSYPAINHILADRAQSQTRNKNIIMLTRWDAHKGFDLIEPLVTTKLSGYSVDIYLGNGKMPWWQKMKLKRSFQSCGMRFEVHKAIAGVKKFEKLKQAALLYFPSQFEGFGIPPLEAAYCNLPCVCSDLPVLKEYGGDFFVFGDRKNGRAMQDAVLSALNNFNYSPTCKEKIHSIAHMDSYGQRLTSIFEKM